MARISFALLFFIVTVLQLFSFPGQFAHLRKVEGFSLLLEVEGFSLLLELALTFIVGALFLSAQIVIFSIFKLINFMEKGNFFSGESIRWVNRIVKVLKWALLLPCSLILIIAPQADDPGVLVMLTAITLFIFSLFLISSLLRDQIESKREKTFG
jgi:hypothetical protein